MDQIFEFYPDFIKDNVCDMLYGTHEYQKQLYDKVMVELLKMTSKSMMWETKIDEIESLLDTVLGTLLISYSRYNIITHIFDQYYNVMTIFVLEWSPLYEGPDELYLVYDNYQWKLDTRWSFMYGNWDNRLANNIHGYWQPLVANYELLVDRLQTIITKYESILSRLCYQNYPLWDPVNQ